MDAKKALVATRRTVGFVAFGGAWWSMKMSAVLLRKEFARTKENAVILGEMAKEAKDRFSDARATANPDAESFESAARSAAAKGVSVVDVYLHFLTRKRIALAMAVVFLCVGAAGVAMGSLLGVLPMVVGTGFCLEMAWLSEFRLWQVRNRCLSPDENASVRDFARAPSAWRGALRFEAGAYVRPDMRCYRGWLIGKRVGLLITGVGLGLAIVRYVAPGPFLLLAGGGLVIALVGELRLSVIRPRVGLRHPRFAALRLELGTGYERGEA